MFPIVLFCLRKYLNVSNISVLWSCASCMLQNYLFTGHTNNPYTLLVKTLLEKPNQTGVRIATLEIPCCENLGLAEMPV